MTLSASVAGIAVWGPGLPGWDSAKPVLRGETPLAAIEQPPPVPAMLPANERRRSGLVVRLALDVASRAVAMAGLAPDSLRSVFASANGDGAVIHAILETLASPPVQVSPTQFHNSVHNAPAGYWAIGAGSRQATTCFGCHDATFAAALLKTMAEIACDQVPMLLCLYDAPLPPPIAPQRPTAGSFAAAFVLHPDLSPTRPTITVDFAPEPAPPDLWEPRDPALRSLAHGNPAARALRLLEALARRQPDHFAAELLDGRVDIRLLPCSTAATSSN